MASLQTRLPRLFKGKKPSSSAARGGITQERPMSPHVYGAASYYQTRYKTGRQDFVTMGRQDKRAMVTNVWTPRSTIMLHPQKERSKVYLVRGSQSRQGIEAFGSSTYHDAVSDVAQDS